MINEEKLINWCWENLEFSNCPENWEDTEIIDILNGYMGTIRDKKGNLLSYGQIRNMFLD